MKHGFMSIGIAEFLNNPSRGWRRVQPATEDAIQTIQKNCAWELPKELLDLWRFSNGGEAADIALPPLLFVLDSVEEATKSIGGEFINDNFPGLVFFGGNGGLERIALDYRSGCPPSVVMVDPIAGIESAQQIASNIEEFIRAIGSRYQK
jgi:hypothetical protein